MKEEKKKGNRNGGLFADHLLIRSYLFQCQQCQYMHVYIYIRGTYLYQIHLQLIEDFRICFSFRTFVIDVCKA